MPWAALARLQIPGVSRCTAFLVAPQTAVTAAHCLYGRRLGHFVPPGSVHILTGYDRGRFVRHEVAQSYTLAPGYDPQSGPSARALDLAILHFAAPLALPGQTLSLLDGPVPPGAALALGGYGQDRAEALLADTACTAQGTAGAGAAAMLVHDCEGTLGTSGAPLLARDAAGAWGVAGVQATGRANGAGGTAIPASAVRVLLTGNPVP